MIRSFTLVLTGILTMNCTLSAAFVVIDPFDNPSPRTFMMSNNPFLPVPTLTNPVIVTTTVPNNYTRTATVGVDTPLVASDSVAFSGFLGYNTSPAVLDGRFSFSSADNTRVHALFDYSSLNPSLTNFNATGLPVSLNFDFILVDPGIVNGGTTNATNIPVDVAISTTSGTLSGTYFLSGSALQATTKIDLFTLTGTGDLHNVTGFRFDFNDGPNQRIGTDFTLTAITLETVPTPLPPTALLGLLAVPVLNRLRRRRA